LPDDLIDRGSADSVVSNAMPVTALLDAPPPGPVCFVEDVRIGTCGQPIDLAR
jgi:hypothetical protein